MLSRPISIVKNISVVQKRTFASKNVGAGGGTGGGAFRGASENTSTTTSQTSNSPNFGTSNNSGGRFSGNPNQGASNTASPASSSKATSTSGTSQATGTGSSAIGKNHKGGVQPQDDSSMGNLKSNEASPSGNGNGFSSFLKNAFGGGVAKDGSTENLSTESSNLNRGSIPTNEGATFTQDTGSDPSVKASIKDRQGSGSVAPNVGKSSSSSSQSTSSSQSPSTSTGFSSGGSQVNRNTVGSAHSLETTPMSPDLVQARSSLQFDSVTIRYGYLLWSTYKEAGALEQLDDDLEKFYNLVGESESLAKVFDNSELMSESGRESSLEKFLERGGQLDDKIVAFLRTLGEMRRLSDLKNILGAIHEIREKVERGVHTALVTSAKPLSDSDRESIRNTIMSTFSPKGEVKIEEEIKPELGGGFEIYYDGKYHLDNTQRSLVSELDEDINSAITSFMNKRS